MLYQLYDAQQIVLTPLRLSAAVTQKVMDRLPTRLAQSPVVRYPSAWCDMVAHTRLTHTRPAMGISTVSVGGRPVGVSEEATVVTPFGRLTHFRKDVVREEPRVLIVAALSGHFATLMRDTVQTMLADHDVYLAEWHNAREVPLDEGRFGLDEYIDHLIAFLEHLGPPAHVVAVCQPCPAVLAATTVLAMQASPAQPRSLTLMAGPIDTSISPNAVNDLAHEVPLSWFEENVVMPVPPGHAGFGRKVYPGFLQLAAFVNMNLQRHLDQHSALYWNLVRGQHEEARTIREFYDEYFAVLDIDADFYLDTIDAVFQRNLLANGELRWHGELIDPGKIKTMALMTVEGENDDVCGTGQTLAAHDLLSGLKPASKRHHLQVGVGHYGVFSGRRWQQETYPLVREFILASA